MLRRHFLAIRCAVRRAAIAAALITIASLTRSSAYNDEFTPLDLIPKYRTGDRVYSDSEFEEFLDLMLTAGGPQEAYDISAERFGRFPLRFGRTSEYQVLIISFRFNVLHLSAGCALSITKAEYISPTSKPRGSRGWIYIYPGGPIAKDVVMPDGTAAISAKEMFARESGSSSWGVLRGTADVHELFNRFDKYCREQERTPSWPHYRER